MGNSKQSYISFITQTLTIGLVTFAPDTVYQSLYCLLQNQRTIVTNKREDMTVTESESRDYNNNNSL